MKREPGQAARLLYPVPDPFDTMEQFEKFVCRDLDAMSMPELIAEQQRVRLVLLIQPSPNAWFLKRLQAIEEAMREAH